MSETGVAAFDRTIQKTNTWLKEIMQRLGRDREAAYCALRATLHTLRDRLPGDHVAHLGAQLPLLIRGVYYEGWRPSAPPSRERHTEAFLAHLRRELRRVDLDPEEAARAVLAVLSEHVTEGESDRIRESLPKEIRALFAPPPAH